MSQSMLMLVIGGLVGSTALLAGIVLLIHRQTQRILAFDQRLAVPRESAFAYGLNAEHQTSRSPRARSAPASGLALFKVLSMMAPVGAAEREKLAQLLRHAGFAQHDALSIYLSLKLAVAAATSAGAVLVAQDLEIASRYPGFVLGLSILAGFVIGGLVPEYGLRMRIARRSRRMARALPDALDLMVMCLESGLTFERAITTVADELMPIEPNLAGQFRLLEAELRVSADRRAVLQEFHRRTQVEGLRDLAMSLIQSERYGTPLSQSMKNIAENERIQRAARIEAQTERLPVLMTLPMILLVVPGTMALVAGPAFLTVIQALGKMGGD